MTPRRFFATQGPPVVDPHKAALLELVAAKAAHEASLMDWQPNIAAIKRLDAAWAAARALAMKEWGGT